MIKIFRISKIRKKLFLDGFSSAFDMSGTFLINRPLIKELIEPIDETVGFQIKNAISAARLDAAQAEADRVLNKAIEKLIKALENTSNAVIQVGSILLVKHAGKAYVKRLTHDEMRAIEQAGSDDMRSPQLMLYQYNMLPLEEVLFAGAEFSDLTDANTINLLVAAAESLGR